MSDALLGAPVVPLPRSAAAADAVADLLAAADDDAERLADRLHDGALQALVVARYAADAAVRGADPALAREAVQDALVALRQVVWHLRPRGGDDLVRALNELSARRADAGSSTITVDVDAAVCAALPASARAAAYRFVQAATLAAGPAEVRVERAGAHAAVCVTATSDDVPGWSARAAALGGRLEPFGSGLRLLLPLTLLPHTALHHDDPEGDR